MCYSRQIPCPLKITSNTNQSKVSHDKAFEKAIATFRKQSKLRQSDIKGVSSRQVSRIENGENTKLETLELFAKAHKLEINDYLEAIADFMNRSVC
ncbi:MAG: helix-turn-helix transcriptional regulator [Limnothrix sp. RL_2_0]|nr:helix-turn-helix transcriptional regulator [Limnothrix sp. RL_2_0]